MGFNAITAIPTRNVTAMALNHIQDAGAKMLEGVEITYDDLVIQNLMFLGEMTDAEFLEGTTPDENVAAEVDQHPAGDVLEPRLELVADNSIGQNNDLSELDAQNVEATPVDDVTTVDVKTED